MKINCSIGKSVNCIWKLLNWGRVGGEDEISGDKSEKMLTGEPPEFKDNRACVEAKDASCKRKVRV